MEESFRYEKLWELKGADRGFRSAGTQCWFLVVLVVVRDARVRRRECVALDHRHKRCHQDRGPPGPRSFCFGDKAVGFSPAAFFH